MSDPLKQELIHWFDAQTLPDEQIEAILVRGRSIHYQHRLRLGLLIAGLVSLALLALLLSGPSGPTATPLAQKLAQSHVTHVPSEFDIPADSFAALDLALDKLDFDMVPAEPALRSRFSITGARYCSIDGGIACAFAVQERESRTHGSLYVSRRTDRLDKRQLGQESVLGGKVETWRDGELFFAFVTVPRPSGDP